MKKITVPIKGMHCKSCEMLIEEKVLEIKGVEKVELSHKKGLAEISYSSEKLDMDKIKNAIHESGYEIGTDKKYYLLTQEKENYKDFGIALLFLIGIYLVAKNFGLTNINLAPSESSFSLPVVLMVGLAAGFSTCMALVGGLVLGISARHSEIHPEASPMQKFRPHLFFNFGRVLGYAILGGLLGAAGSFLQMSGFVLGALTLLVGAVMLVMGLKLTGMFPILDNFNFTLPKSIARFFGAGKHTKEYSHKGSVVAGALTFFLPCGFTQAMQLFAVSTGSLLQGALIMGVFALGTTPGLLGIGGLTSFVKGIFARRFFKLAGIVVVLMALFNISNGYNLIKIQNPIISNQLSVNEDSASAKTGEVQVIKMDQNGNGYSPSNLTVKKGVPVRWEITGNAPYSCASSFIVPKLGIQKTLKKGLNVIEFTPTESGTIPFSCSMGMYTGTIVVTDEVGKVPATKAQEKTQAPVPTNAPSAASCH